jgi:hypothetical protein
VADREYDVGYGKPPKRTQFRKGQTGNPKGRPKGTKNIARIVDQVCRERVRVKGENGNYYYMTKMQAIMTQLTNQAARGDIKATRMCFAILDMFPEIKEPALAQPPALHVHFVDPKDGAPAPLEGNDDKAKLPPEER